MTLTQQKAKVECPRCHKIWTVPAGQPDIDCNCHTYCQHGSKPSDCTMVAATSGTWDAFAGKWKWPSGLHNMESHEGDDTQARVYYCTTHNVYSNKTPITINVDWSRWYGRRANKKFRMSHGRY